MVIPFVRDITFEYGRTDRVTPLIRRVIANNPGPFTFTGTGTYIVGGGDSVVVIDPGPEDSAHLDAILAAVEGERVTHILITHHHLDHSPLARPLQEKTGAVIYGCAVKELPAEDTGVRTEAGYDRFTPDISVCGGGQTIAGTGWTFEAIATPGHTSNHICYALAQERCCFTGDHIMGWSTTVVTPPDGDMGAYVASLDLIKARNFKTLWPTHGPPITDVAHFIDEYKAHRFDRERQILDQLAAGETKIASMVPKMYAGVDPRLYPAAARSVHAHMIQLVRSGRVETDGEAALTSDYRLG
jgi:glyoxylase-like metal-dependent hydrolase (beta-lactamase superfamily II)